MSGATVLADLASRTGSDPLVLGVALQGVFGAGGALLLGALRGRAAAWVVGAAAACLTILCALLFAGVVRNVGFPAPPAPRVLFSAGDRLWTYARFMGAGYWHRLATALVVLLFLLSFLHVCILPALALLAAAGAIADADRDVHDGPDGDRSAWSRVVVVVAVAAAGAALSLGFATAIAVTRSSLPHGERISLEVARQSSDLKGFIFPGLRFQGCLCGRFGECSPPVSSVTCAVSLVEDLKPIHLYQCLTGVVNMTKASQERLVDVFEPCVGQVTGPRGPVAFTIMVLVLLACGSVILAATWAAQLPLPFTVAFLATACITAPVVFATTLPLMIRSSSVAQIVFGVGRKNLFLAVGTGPESVRLVRVAIAALIGGVVIMLCASLVEFTRYASSLQIYALLRLRPVREAFEPEGYKYEHDSR